MNSSLVILGSGYTARFVLPLAERRYSLVLATSREPDRHLNHIQPNRRIQFDLTRQDGVLIAFNVKFLREALEVIKTPNVALETSAPNAPGVIKPVGDDNFLHVIMPMHLG